MVLIPDHPLLKAKMNAVFKEDLFLNRPSSIVQQTSDQLEKFYDVQAHPREINLFYLKDDILNYQERIS